MNGFEYERLHHNLKLLKLIIFFPFWTTIWRLRQKKEGQPSKSSITSSIRSFRAKKLDLRLFV
jgi:hypothetical protein